MAGPVQACEGSGLRWAVLVVALGALACGDEAVGADALPVDHAHDAHGDAGIVTDAGHHELRDLVAEPCAADNWRQLLPDLRECELAGVALGGESLRRANLSRASLVEADLAGADLFKAVLVGADLTGARAAGANFTSTDLSGADLTGTDLRGARLTNAALTSATLTGVVTDATTTCVDGAPGPCW